MHSQETVVSLNESGKGNGYLLLDAVLCITMHNSSVLRYLLSPPPTIIGLPATELPPELVGAEAYLHQIAAGEEAAFIVSQVFRPEVEEHCACYFDLRVEPININEAVLFVTIEDVTRQTVQEQKLQQQRNELALLSARLSETNEQLAYLIQKFVPESVAKKLIASRKLPEPGGESYREATLLFADMRNFTAVAENVAPTELMDLLNSYFNIMAEEIVAHDGSLIQIVGDMLMVSFNIPEEQTDHALRGTKTALALQKKINCFLQENQGSTLAPVRFGIGVHTGFVAVGYLGVRERFRYALVGDATNVAFHLCAYAAADQIIVSQALLDQLEVETAVSFLGYVKLKRRRQTIPIYELTGFSQSVTAKKQTL